MSYAKNNQDPAPCSPMLGVSVGPTLLLRLINIHKHITFAEKGFRNPWNDPPPPLTYPLGSSPGQPQATGCLNRFSILLSGTWTLFRGFAERRFSQGRISGSVPRRLFLTPSNLSLLFPTFDFGFNVSQGVSLPRLTSRICLNQLSKFF
ncbi:hypothetical protein PoB_001600400 [Plakobranchus ocellatus]|uniref:Uncharacterized protein n=1 Tax=Plakobranchus ocellatus TaxID=259542 RepID=A0AAV3Z671_9GAST|nr:hypothetical protein PoB_001600400 [Plakobranchus ocellatus]